RASPTIRPSQSEATAVAGGSASTPRAHRADHSLSSLSLVLGLEGYRSNFIGQNTYGFGDGGSFSTGSATTIATGTDLAGESFTIRRTVVEHTYANDGPWLISFQSCCRIGSIVNPSSGQRMEAVVDLSNGDLGSPVSSIPPMLQMELNELNVVPLPIADPDGDPFSCRMATLGESLINAVAAQTNALSVSSDCVLSWQTDGTSVAQKYAVQVVIEEDNGATRVPLDFIIEIVPDLGEPPECALGGNVHNVVFAGDSFSISATGTDLDGDDLTVGHLGLPAGATLSPVSGTTGPQPFEAWFDWTPTPADVGVHAITITFTDINGLQTVPPCGFTINVPANVPPVCDANGPYVVECQGETSEVSLD
ncbi:MAG: hypothetical protein V3V08_17330, partial [Nannocystaceae bacterium]